jgi:hypothetical protein
MIAKTIPPTKTEVLHKFLIGVLVVLYLPVCALIRYVHNRINAKIERKNKKAKRLELNALKRCIGKLDDILADANLQNAESRYELEHAKGTYDDTEGEDIETAVERFIKNRNGE